MTSRRSTGTSVVVPPAARMASSSSSRPPTVRAASTTWAPSAAKRRATAAPMPREAPVISAILPASRPLTGSPRLTELPTKSRSSSTRLQLGDCRAEKRQRIPPCRRVCDRKSADYAPLFCPTTHSCAIPEPSSGFGEEGQLHGDLAVIGVDVRDRIITGKAGVAEVRRKIVSPRLAHRPVEPINRQEGKAVDADQLGHSGDIQAGGEELVTLRGGDPVKTRMARRRARDPHVDLPRSGPPHHFHDLYRSGAAHDRVVDEDHALAGKIGPARVVLQTDTEMANLVGRLDESSTDVMIADDAKLERQSRFLGIADRGGYARIRDRHDDVRVDRIFASEFLSDALARFVNTPAFDDTVGAGEVDVLEDTEPTVAPAEGLKALEPTGADDNDFARGDIADELRADDVESAGLRREDPGVAEPAEY